MGLLLATLVERLGGNCLFLKKIILWLLVRS